MLIVALNLIPITRLSIFASLNHKYNIYTINDLQTIPRSFVLFYKFYF